MRAIGVEQRTAFQLHRTAHANQLVPGQCGWRTLLATRWLNGESTSIASSGSLQHEPWSFDISAGAGRHIRCSAVCCKLSLMHTGVLFKVRPQELWPAMHTHDWCRRQEQCTATDINYTLSSRYFEQQCCWNIRRRLQQARASSRSTAKPQHDGYSSIDCHHSLRMERKAWHKADASIPTCSSCRTAVAALGSGYHQAPGVVYTHNLHPTHCTTAKLPPPRLLTMNGCFMDPAPVRVSLSLA